MKLKKTYFVITDNTLKNNLNIFLNYSFEELNRFLKKRGFDLLKEKYSASNGVAFICYKGKIPHFTIWISNFKWLLSGQALMVHELSHVVFQMLDYKGINIEKPENDANEIYAYLLEYFFLETSRKISKILSITPPTLLRPRRGRQQKHGQRHRHVNAKSKH